MKRYISVNIYRRDGVDCTNGGVSSYDSKYKMYLVECPDGNFTDESIESLNSRGDYVCVLYLNEIKYGRKTFYNFKPKGEGWFMNGGNFAYSSDSRFSREYGDYPIPIHDRIE